MDYKKNVNIDLHIHSSASDGTLSSSEILVQALKQNLGAIAITDHDSIEGSREAISAGIPSSIKFLTGVEISATPPPGFVCPGSFHILGFGINLNDVILNRTLEMLQKARRNRNPQILERLNRLGMMISLKEVESNVREGQIGRPHIADLMVKKGFVKSSDDAFDRYLGKGKPAYIDKFRIDSACAIETIAKAGGIAVLAHPFLLNIAQDEIMEDLIVTLKTMGLKGLEVYYPAHTPEYIDHYAALARRHDLLMTGGSDFHGLLKPGIQMGSGTGNLNIPFELYERIAEQIKNETYRFF
ncbi:MAG: PHP domain-containing protein [Desulfobacterales bacterium]